MCIEMGGKSTLEKLRREDMGATNRFQEHRMTKRNI